jgi:hypothetical protein
VPTPTTAKASMTLIPDPIASSSLRPMLHYRSNAAMTNATAHTAPNAASGV